MTWNPSPHGELEQLEDNLWTVEGALPNMALRRRMVVVRMSDGGLLIHSAMALQAEAMAQLEALGAPTVLLVPNGFHRLDAPGYRERYPSIRVYCPAASRAKVEQKVPVDDTLDNLPPDPNLEVRTLADNKVGEAALIVSHPQGRRTVVLNDALFNHPHVPGVAGLFLRLLGSTGSPPRVTRVARLGMVRDRKAFADALRALADTEGLCRILVSHGDPIEDEPAAVLRAAAAGLG